MAIEAPSIPTQTTGTTPMGQEHHVVAMFETYDQARSARDRLAQAGVQPNEMDILDRNAEPSDASFTYEHTEEGVWGAIKRFFMPESDVHHYAEGWQRGHAMLVVRPRPEQRERVIEILEQSNPIDFDARTEEWRQAGWSGTYAGQPASAAAERAPSAGQPATTAPTREAGTPVRAGQEEVIPVVEEQIRVGKREVGRGSVRVRSYIVERPVHEQVQLREETVRVERHPVDRPVSTVPEDAFQERTIEVTAVGEEAVIAKEARIVEEVAIRKDEVERTETVEDTVRRTEVKVEDDRGTAPAPRATEGKQAGKASEPAPDASLASKSKPVPPTPPESGPTTTTGGTI